jgi:arylsulfatase A-like enzyme
MQHISYVAAKALIAVAFAIASLAPADPAVAQDTPPNLVIIFVDDLGYGDLGSYGHPTILTPNLDRMADEGMRFTQFYTAASVCTPSRAGLLTGRYPVRTRLVRGFIPGRVLFPDDQTGLPSSEVTIAEVLKTRGYATLAVGKWHLGHLPEFLPTSNGFDGYLGIPYSNDMDFVPGENGEPGYWNVPLMRDTTVIERPAVQETLTKRYTEESVRFIRDHAEDPFFLYLAHTMPHIPLFNSTEFDSVSARGLYGDVVEEIDWSVGRILSTLEEIGIAGNTLVVFTSDNGPWLVQREHGGSAGLLRDGKGTTWEGGMRVPMIAWWPGSVPGGETSLELAATMDLLPTAASLSGADLPDRKLDGYDLMPVLLGQGTSERDFLAYYRDDRVYAVRSGPWKAHFFTQTEYPAGPLMEHDPPQLYNVEHDPSERFDVSADHPAVIEMIRAKLEAHEATVERARVPIIEAESLIDQAHADGGMLEVQKMDSFRSEWGGDAQLWWVKARPGDVLTIPLYVDEGGEYELVGFFTRAKDYGIISLQVNGQEAGQLFDGYSPQVEASGPVSFGRFQLMSGENEVKITLVGKDVRSGGYSDGFLVGIDGFTLRN